jgi:UDP-N-acetylenolpyruvoylglucosamine reductase
VNLVHIESRLSKTNKENYEFFVDCKAKTKQQLEKTIEDLKEKTSYFQIFTKGSNIEIESGIITCLLNQEERQKNQSINLFHLLVSLSSMVS